MKRFTLFLAAAAFATSAHAQQGWAYHATIVQETEHVDIDAQVTKIEGLRKKAGVSKEDIERSRSLLRASVEANTGRLTGSGEVFLFFSPNASEVRNIQPLPNMTTNMVVRELYDGKVTAVLETIDPKLVVPTPTRILRGDQREELARLADQIILGHYWPADLVKLPPIDKGWELYGMPPGSRYQNHVVNLVRDSDGMIRQATAFVRKTPTLLVPVRHYETLASAVVNGVKVPTKIKVEQCRINGDLSQTEEYAFTGRASPQLSLSSLIPPNSTVVDTRLPGALNDPHQQVSSLWSGSLSSIEQLKHAQKAVPVAPKPNRQPYILGGLALFALGSVGVVILRRRRA